MAIFNSYVKLPEGKMIRDPGHGMRTETASLPSTFLRKHPGHTARQNNQRGHGGIGDASNGTFRRHYGVPNSVVEPLMCLLCLCHERLP